jgi:hypothetical protein
MLDPFEKIGKEVIKEIKEKIQEGMMDFSKKRYNWMASRWKLSGKLKNLWPCSNKNESRNVRDQLTDKLK